MNESGFVGNQSVEQYDINNNRSQELDTHIATIRTLQDVIVYVAFSLGIPGNILSAIVWLRRHVTGKNSAAVYLAALAINDFIYLFTNLIIRGVFCRSWFCRWFSRYCCWNLGYSATVLEPLLVLGLSVERLIAIVRPFQVCYTVY